MDVLRALRLHAADRPHTVALTDGETSISYIDLKDRVVALAKWLTDRGCRRLGLLLDNGLPWALFDLAARQAGGVVVPIPSFFSNDQIRHVIEAAGLDHLATDQAARVETILQRPVAETAPPIAVSDKVAFLSLPDAGSNLSAALPGSTQKITFTSGTTGRPKGVCLSHTAIDRVAASLLLASEGTRSDRHLCLLPLATLLENITGIYVPLMAGATCCIPPLADVGLVGSSQLDVATMFGAILRLRATTVVMVPQMLLAMLAVLSPDTARHTSLRLIAVGGAPLPLEALHRAERLGLPVRQGYGLSECSSVVALNSMAENRPGSVGKPLPHADIRIAPDGEILVRGATCEGFLGEPMSPQPLYWPTGDIGNFDADGFLHLAGRKKHMFITSFGRNVAPEWIECELAIEPDIAQAAVFGEMRPWNAAVIVPRQPAGAPVNSAQLAGSIRRVNARLPDYARIHRWIIADGPFTPVNQLMTTNGRLRRERIEDLYRNRLDHLYDDEAALVSR